MARAAALHFCTGRLKLARRRRTQFLHHAPEGRPSTATTLLSAAFLKLGQRHLAVEQELARIGQARIGQELAQIAQLLFFVCFNHVLNS